MDKTVTTGGKDNLKRIFGNPKNNIEEIKKNQDSLKYIIKDLSTWNLIVSKKHMGLIECYYFSKIAPVLSENKFEIFLEEIFKRLKHKDFGETGIQLQIKFPGVKYSFRFINS